MGSASCESAGASREAACERLGGCGLPGCGRVAGAPWHEYKQCHGNNKCITKQNEGWQWNTTCCCVIERHDLGRIPYLSNARFWDAWETALVRRGVGVCEQGRAVFHCHHILGAKTILYLLKAEIQGVSCHRPTTDQNIISQSRRA